MSPEEKQGLGGSKRIYSALSTSSYERMLRNGISLHRLPFTSSLLFYFFILTFAWSGLISAIKSPSTSTRLSLVKVSDTMAPKKNKSKANAAAAIAELTEIEISSSSVLRELKETIRSQASEIAKLKEAMSSSTSTKKASSSAGGHHHGGTSTDEDGILAYKTKPFYTIAQERVGWLAFFICTLSLTAMIMNGFEHTLSRQIQLAYFVPLLAGHGGNTGGQAVGTVLSALSAGVVTRNDAFGVITKEATSGLCMGLVLGSIIGPVAHYVMGIHVHVATVVSVTLPLLSTIAATLGSSIPFLCVALGLDPSVIAAPAMTSFVDVTGLMCYFLLANKIFKLFGLEL